jgi:hypothetical protein
VACPTLQCHIIPHTIRFSKKEEEEEEEEEERNKMVLEVKCDRQT